MILDEVLGRLKAEAEKNLEFLSNESEGAAEARNLRGTIYECTGLLLAGLVGAIEAMPAPAPQPTECPRCKKRRGDDDDDDDD